VLVIKLVGILMVVAVIYNFWRCIGTPNKNYEKRTKIMEDRIESIGGKVITIETTNRSDYPFHNNINQDDGSIHVFYKIQYSINDEIKEGWAILKLQQSLVGPIGATLDEWIWDI
jgi:hypothetical protein